MAILSGRFSVLKSTVWASFACIIISDVILDKPSALHRLQLPWMSMGGTS